MEKEEREYWRNLGKDIKCIEVTRLMGVDGERARGNESNDVKSDLFIHFKYQEMQSAVWKERGVCAWSLFQNHTYCIGASRRHDG